MEEVQTTILHTVNNNRCFSIMPLMIKDFIAGFAFVRYNCGHASFKTCHVFLFSASLLPDLLPLPNLHQACVAQIGQGLGSGNRTMLLCDLQARLCLHSQILFVNSGTIAIWWEKKNNCCCFISNVLLRNTVIKHKNKYTFDSIGRSQNVIQKFGLVFYTSSNWFDMK